MNSLVQWPLVLVVLFGVWGGPGALDLLDRSGLRGGLCLLLLASRFLSAVRVHILGILSYSLCGNGQVLSKG
jgi:hypothetical protein